MSAYYATGGPVQRPAVQSPLTPLQVSFAGPAPQSRVTVAFRLLLAVPHLVILVTMAVGAGVVAFIGWFGALFTGQLPVFAADFLTGYLRWLARVQAYQYLLTDQYPPFTLDDQDYPVRLAVPAGQRLNRAAVFFRFYLLIPAWIVVSVLSYGALTLFQFVSWLIVLVNGQLPDTIYQALSSVLRYNYRFLAFALMLTSTYPAGLFGDPEPADWRQWPLTLSAPARKLLVFFIVFGAVISVGYSVHRVTSVVGDIPKLEATAQVSLAAIPARAELASYSSDESACHGQPGCRAEVNRELSGTLSTFASQLRTISVPPQAATAKTTLIKATSNLSAVYGRLGTASSVNQYDGIGQTASIEIFEDQFDIEYDNLLSALRS